MASSRKQPDWNEFYKNGVPKEIIVIDDDDDEPEQQSARTDARPRQDQGSFSSYNGRKRKIDRGYDAEYNDSPTYSTHPAKFGGSSSSASYHSGDRTASLQTITAPTSLESYGSNAASNSYEDVRVGQKRKRVQPERTQSRKKKQESVPDAFADYIPPSKPVKKSAEVPVPVIRDVKPTQPRVTARTDLEQNVSKHHKVDDDDGHYIVQANSVMTDRCEHSPAVNLKRA